MLVQIIAEPMDLSTMTERLRTFYYMNAEECVRDFKLMCL